MPTTTDECGHIPEYLHIFSRVQEFKDLGVTHIKIKCPGKVVPNDDIYDRYVKTGRLSD